MAPAAPVSCPRCDTELGDAPNFCPECGEDLRRRRRSARGPEAGTGRVVGGRYRLLERLGEGGMGAVWRAEHVRMGKVLALKLVRPDVATHPRLRARFQEEARLVSQLSHPNTIQVFDAGELADGGLYLAMEYLPGRDLARTLREEGPLPEKQVLAIGSQVLASLAEAHELGIVHRDIKPANVMRVQGRPGEERVKVLDFGIAKLTQPEGGKHITGTADVVGTPAYMSPEQARGEPLDARSDLYSVGALLFELATGKPVYRGPSPMHVVAQLLDDRRPPPRPSEADPDRELSPAFEALLQRALAKRPGERFPSADAMRQAVDAVRRQLGAPLRDALPETEWVGADVAQREDFARLERRLRRRRRVMPLLVLAGLGVGGWQVARRLREAEAQALREVEREPNDVPERANRVALGQPVRGRMVAGPSVERGDRDVYRLDGVQGPLTVELSGVPDLNLVVEVSELERGADGQERLRRRLLLDDAPAGGPEHVDGLLTAASTLYVRVEERAHALEAPRPPRESRRTEYTLVVRAGPTAHPGEVEPNDAPEGATRVETGHAVVGHAGVYVGFPLDPRQPAPSAADCFAAVPPAATAGPLYAVVVPPPSGALWLEDASAADRMPAEAWDAGVDVATGFVRAAGGPQVLALGAGPRGHVLRVLPGSPDTPPGAEYRAAFFFAGEEGREGVEDLARVLEEEGRPAERAALLQQVEAVLHPPVVALPDAGVLEDGGVLAEGSADAGSAGGGDGALLVLGGLDGGELPALTLTLEGPDGGTVAPVPLALEVPDAGTPGPAVLATAAPDGGTVVKPAEGAGAAASAADGTP